MPVGRGTKLQLFFPSETEQGQINLHRQYCAIGVDKVERCCFMVILYGSPKSASVCARGNQIYM